MQSLIRFSANLLFTFCASAALNSHVNLSGDDLPEEKTALESPAADWAIDPASGRVFCTLAGGDSVLEFNSKGKELNRFKAGKNTTEILIKKNRLVVASSDDCSIRVFGLEMNELIGQVQLFGKGPYGLFCSDVDNHLVYAICNTGTAWWDGEIFQIDIKKLAIRKRIKVQGWGQSHPLHVAMSRDGKWIIPDARGASSPSGADLMKVDEDEFTFTQVRDYHSSFGVITAGPYNRYWGFGNALYTRDIQKKIRNFTGSPIAIHPKYDLVASISKNRLHLEKFSDASHISATTLAAAGTSIDRSGRTRRTVSRFDPTVSFDMKNKLVFVGLQNSGHWIQMSSLLQELTPIKLIDIPSEIVSKVGFDSKTPIRVTNSNLAPKTEIQLENSMKSVSLENGTLVIKPTAEDVGINVLKLNLVSTATQKVLDSIETTVSITLPKVEFDFATKSMAVSKSGKFAVVWGLATKDRNRHPAHTGAEEMAVVDLEKGKIIKQKTLPQGMRAADIDDNYVYFSPNSGNLFYRSNHSLDETKRQFVQYAPQSLTLDGKVISIRGDRSAPSTYYDADTLKEIPKSKVSSSKPTTLKLPITSSNSQSFSALPQLNEFRVFPNTGRISSSRMGSNDEPRWGRRMNNAYLTNTSGNQIQRWPGQRQGFISKKWPMAVLIGTANDNRARTVTKTLELCDLIDGTVKHTGIISVSRATSRSPSFYGNRNTLVEVGDTVILLDGNSLLMIPIPVDVAKKMPVPTHFADTQTQELEVGKSDSIKLKLIGDTAGTTYSLSYETETVNIDEDSGIIKTDLETLWKKLTDSVYPYSTQGSVFRVSSPRSSSREFRFQDISAAYKKETGKTLPADKIAARLFISARLTDKEGQSDQAMFNVIVVGPRKPIEVRIAARIAEMKKQNEEREKARIARAKEMEQRQKERVSESETGLAKRVEELEKRMRRMEATLDAILNKLDKRN